VVGNGVIASSQDETEIYLNTNSLRQLSLRHSYIAAPDVPHRVQTGNAGPQRFVTSFEGNIAAVKLQLISRYEIVQKTYLIILI